MPSEPVESGCSARIARPAAVSVRRAGVHRAAERLDHHLAVGLLVVRRPHLPDLALQAELRARERQRRAPLPGTGLGGQPPDARLRVVERLRHRGVRLVRAGRRDAFVLVVDPRRRAERLLQPVRPEQRARPPQPVDVEHLLGDVDVLLGRRPPAGSGPSGTAAPGRPARPAARCRGAAPAAAGSAGRAARCTSGSASRSSASRILCWRMRNFLPDRRPRNARHGTRCVLRGVDRWTPRMRIPRFRHIATSASAQARSAGST